MYTDLQLREIFHIEFLRWLGRKLKPNQYALKGGVNLRLFFGSIRYSEDLDIDVMHVAVATLKKNVMQILENQSFLYALKAFGIGAIQPPDLTKAKQTETTQRFKIHLKASNGLDLFTKIECSRREQPGETDVGVVGDLILKRYKISPVLIPHYHAPSVVVQKLGALTGRTVVQARDVFDLYLLSSQISETELCRVEVNQSLLKKAYERVMEIDFQGYKAAVVSFLSPEDQRVYGERSSWGNIQSKVLGLLEALGHEKN